MPIVRVLRRFDGDGPGAHRSGIAEILRCLRLRALAPCLHPKSVSRPFAPDPCIRSRAAL
ncbi:hypothetical protein WQQ_43820 [Hydrocarboniphaga effusa AP103]|uniref:Uncharacterized protein n=1 Tax=Hydrocarboniphaga effusa AP103 TaxID=1172194 RepID=I7Z8I1_9GAMM|nr:hypothetical protein WQQ_43820 [Hydrocarboniphaga effusa AP103]